MIAKGDGPTNSPRLVTTIDDTRAVIALVRQEGKTIGFVPTMGALHAGHISLIDIAKQSGAYVVVSVYVNPTQFDSRSDLEHYPRILEADLEACAKAGVGLVFAPETEAMYPPGDQTRVIPGPLADGMCGSSRPGHFDGVCTVVAKLFNIVRPDTAYFGQKDAQQAAIIRRMTRDLCMPVRIEICPLIREEDGLALSSRNVRLLGEDRRRALCLYQALCTGRDLLLGGDMLPDAAVARMREVVSESDSVVIDYLTIVDPDTLEPISVPRGRVMLAGAVRIGDVRLIDNLLVDLPTS